MNQYTEMYFKGQDEAEGRLNPVIESLKKDINELNARLLERQVAFNEADKRRLVRIAELEDQLRLANVKIELWKKQHTADQEIIDKMSAL